MHKPSVASPLGNTPFPGARTPGGKIWLDIVVEQLKETVSYDFAYGANAVNISQIQAGPWAAPPPVADLRDQQGELETLLEQKDVPWTSTNSVFISWFGINDVTFQVYQGRSFDEITTILEPDIDDYFRIMSEQSKLGARRFVSVLIPPIHRAPIFASGVGGNAGDVENATTWWNQQVREKNRGFKSEHQLSVSVIVDPTPVFNRVLDGPKEYGAANNTCFDYSQNAATHCLWHDPLHAGIDIHREFGKLMTKALRSLL